MLKKSSRAARVLLVERDRVRLDLFSTDLPTECAARGCGACKTDSPQIEKFFSKAYFDEDVFAGDLVRVESRLLEDGLAAAILFLTPIFFAAAAYLFATSNGLQPESIRTIGLAFLGAVVGFCTVAVFDKIFCKLNPPQIFKE